jgi:hypothetical protein
MGEPPNPRIRRPSNFRQQDLARAIKAAKGSGLHIARIEVEPSTPRFLLVMKNTATETNINPFDIAPVPETPTRRRKTK